LPCGEINRLVSLARQGAVLWALDLARRAEPSLEELSGDNPGAGASRRTEESERGGASRRGLEASRDPLPVPGATRGVKLGAERVVPWGARGVHAGACGREKDLELCPPSEGCEERGGEERSVGARGAEGRGDTEGGAMRGAMRGADGAGEDLTRGAAPGELPPPKALLPPEGAEKDRVDPREGAENDRDDPPEGAEKLRAPDERPAETPPPPRTPPPPEENRPPD